MLPCRFGGLGLGSIRLQSKFRFNSCLNQIDHPDYDDKLDEKTQYDPLILALKQDRTTAISTLTELHDPREEAFKLSAALLDAIPSDPRFVIDDSTLRVFLAIRLAVTPQTVFPALKNLSYCSFCKCRLTVAHPTHCKARGVWLKVIQRHDDLKYFFYRMFVVASLYPHIEKRSDIIKSRKERINQPAGEPIPILLPDLMMARC